jgi:glycerol-3-phosphate acyltransferase PlsY
MYADFAVAITGAYLLGSIPFGLLIVKAHGKDLRSVGSGNIGATNVSRALGRKWAYVCFLLDVLKGLVPTLGALLLAGPEASGSYAERLVALWLWLAVGCAAVVGHIFPVYVRFKGGKGVATSFGVALGLWPYFTICGAVAIAGWVAAVLIWRYVSLASIVASISFPFTLVAAIALIDNWRFADLWPLLVIATAIPLMVIIRHRQNITRLLNGTEGKIKSAKVAKDK